MKIIKMLLLIVCPYMTYSQIPKGGVCGYVYDATGGRVQFASVQLSDSKEGVITNEEGYFKMLTVKSGIHILRVTVTGYESVERTITIVAGKVIDLSVTLSMKYQPLEDVMVSAMRTNTIASRSPMPVTVIDKKTIEQMGSRRLDEVLREQTGLAVVSDIGSGSRAIGLQMQGFSSSYTQIMIDGQPMVGRFGGNLDLSRITVANIERIEIIKGASSSLFGSEALAGVINIVTRQNISQPQALAAVRYGAFNTTDATLEGETPIAHKRGTAYLSGNYYKTDGFSVNPYLTSGKTAPPYNSYSLQGRSKYAVSGNSFLNISGRFATRNSNSLYAYGTTNPYRDILKETDLNAAAAINTNSENHKTRLKTQYYITRYTSNQRTENASSNASLQLNLFTQYLHRIESQVSHSFRNDLSFTGGGGGTYEIMSNKNYTGNKNRNNYFGYIQADWKPVEKLGIISGARYEYYEAYSGRLNPSIGVSYMPIKALTLKASVGRGYKAPDFKEMYQVFTNPLVGYTVIGSEVFSNTIEQMKVAGQIQDLWAAAGRIKTLKPETSVSYDMGFNLKPAANLAIDGNIFYNDVHNLINTIQVGSNTSGQAIYSYVNIASAYTTGLEAGLSWQPVKGLSLSVGYQLLYAIDRSVVDSIKAGVTPYATIYNTEQPGIKWKARRSDYFGMDNRSRHMGNFRVFYEYAPWDIAATFRMTYRSKYGYEDANQNNYIDRYDTFVDGYFGLNASVQKKFFDEHLSIQVSVDNIMDYTDMLMPGTPGRMIMAGASWRFYKNDK